MLLGVVLMWSLVAQHAVLRYGAASLLCGAFALWRERSLLINRRNVPSVLLAGTDARNNAGVHRDPERRFAHLGNAVRPDKSRRRHQSC